VPRRLAVLLCSAVLAAAAAGCGTREPSDEEQVRGALTALADATAAKDYRRLCEEVFARELLEGIQQIGLPCEAAMRQAFEDVQEPRLTVGRVSVSGQTASAEVRSSARGQEPSSDTVTLVKEEEGWRVSSLGEGDAPPPPEPREP
jgi:hypothetical protein